MKKYLISLICTISLLTACNDTNYTNLPHRIDPPESTESSYVETSEFNVEDTSIPEFSESSMPNESENLENLHDNSHPELSQPETSMPETIPLYNHTLLYNKNDASLAQLVQSKRIFANEITWTESKYQTSLLNALKSWVKPLGFEGGQTTGNNVNILYFPPENNYFEQSITVNCKGERLIDYRVVFYDIEMIDINSIALKLKGLYGIDVNKELLQEAINDHKSSIYSLAPGEAFGRKVYEQDNVYVNVIKANNNGVHFISITSGLLNT